MIAALPDWTGIPHRLALVALCALALGTAAVAYRAHLVDEGIAIEAARRDELDRRRDAEARAALARLDGIVAARQAALDAALAKLNEQGKEISDAQARSAALQSDLAAGRRRLSVALAGTCRAGTTGHGQGIAVARLDPGGGTAAATLDGRVAADLEWMRQTRDDALDGLHACIAAYDAVSAALEPPP